jgi:hypothetical protein
VDGGEEEKGRGWVCGYVMLGLRGHVQLEALPFFSFVFFFSPSFTLSAGFSLFVSFRSVFSFFACLSVWQKLNTASTPHGRAWETFV